LDGRVAIVTGASSGLGARFARVLNAAGARVVLAARRADRLEELAKELDGALAVAGDITDDDAAAALVDRAHREFGTVDILVNNAGTGRSVPAEHESMAYFRSVLALNLEAPFLLSRLAGTIMLAQGRGSIINVSSAFGIVPSGRLPQASYAASKAGLLHLTRELAVQWASRGVRVNAIAPGWYPSELTDVAFEIKPFRAWLHENTPMERVGGQAELDGALLFLAGDASTFLTGQVLAVDGGWALGAATAPPPLLPEP
jgi:NAD(P)-dependent dehydrogenase (short-subunit alcohol dehydrogenase family)